MNSFGTVLVETVRKLDENTGQVIDERKQIGGGAYYAIIGARIWLSPRSLKADVDVDAELDTYLSDDLSQFGSGIWQFKRGNGTTRSLIEYSGETRRFDYLHAPAQMPVDLLTTVSQDSSRYLHIVSSPEEMVTAGNHFDSNTGVASSSSIEFGNSIAERETSPRRPQIVWEVHPKFCSSAHRNAVEDALQYVDIFSPNHDEILKIFGVTHINTTGEVSKTEVEQLGARLMKIGIGPNGNGHLVIRCGGMGAYVVSQNQNPRWIPAYWIQEQQKEKVRDTTGAGNSFLGGFIAGMILSDGDIYKSIAFGAVSASFVVERIGAPALTQSEEGGIERWNGEAPSERLHKFFQRMGDPQRGST